MHPLKRQLKQDNEMRVNILWLQLPENFHFRPHYAEVAKFAYHVLRLRGTRLQ